MIDSTADPALIAEFLRNARPDGQFVLAAIRVEGSAPKVRTFYDAGEAGEWAAGMNANRSYNLYWIHNRLRGSMDRKPAEEDVHEALFTHVDIDPRQPAKDATDEDKVRWNEIERERILAEVRAFQPTPTLVVDSGGGFQCFWRLDAPFVVGGARARVTDIKAYNIGLRDAFEEADSCQSLDHLMRLPFTVNWPDAKKRKKGRAPRLATVVWDNGPVHPLHSFSSVAPAARASSTGVAGVAKVALGELRRRRDLDELPEGFSSRIRAVIVEGRTADPERYPSRSEAVCAVTRELVRAGCDDQMMAELLLNPDFGISESILEHGAKAKAEAAREIANARADVGELTPRILWSEVELTRCLDEAEAALIRSGLPVYQMGDRLVQVVTMPRASGDDDAVRRPAGSLVIASLPKHRLLEHFLRTARFVKINRLKDGTTKDVPYAPPLHFAETYMARAGAWCLPVLTGIATTPTMRSDGSVVEADGYDTASGLIIDTQGVAFPPVPEAPSWNEARTALDALMAVISEFPFVSDKDDEPPGGVRPSQSRSVALAMIVTAVARPMFSAAPMFGVSAPTMATGKSLLADVPAMIVTGRRATKMSQGASEEEDEKRLLSVLMRGDPVNVIDNIARPIEGDALCTVLTEETWRCRVLGRSEMRDVGTRALFIATGNNLSFRNDMASRAVLATIDAQVESPGERAFRLDLKTYVPEHRAELAVAALTVLRAYIAAGRPIIKGMAASRFDGWAVVRAALVWLGEPDPWATNARVAVGDEARAGHRELMDAVGAAFGFGQFLATTEIINRANIDDDMGGNLRLALAGALSHGVSAPGLGRFLNRVAGRRVEGMWIKANPNDKRGNRYAVLSVAKAEPRPSPAQCQMFSGNARDAGVSTQEGANTPF